MEIGLVNYSRSGAPTRMQEAAKKYEDAFGIRFNTLTHFPKSVLDELHGFSASDPTSVPNNVTVASRKDETILKEIDVLSRIANSSSPSTSQRQDYLGALKSIYSKLPSRPRNVSQDTGTLYVGPEREGRILAQAMEWLPENHSIHPNAKRVPYDHGLLVGLDEFQKLQPYSRCIIIDGAIASGATIISVIERLRPVTSLFSIYSVHSTHQGLRAITRYGSSTGLTITITVGHVTNGINSKFYATDPGNSMRLVVGDLGDTIFCLEKKDPGSS